MIRILQSQRQATWKLSSEADAKNFIVPGKRKYCDSESLMRVRLPSAAYRGRWRSLRAVPQEAAGDQHAVVPPLVVRAAKSDDVALLDVLRLFVRVGKKSALDDLV